MIPRSANKSSTSEAQREPNIETDRVRDDFGRKAIAAMGVRRMLGSQDRTQSRRELEAAIVQGCTLTCKR
jgi:hypothetical protein